MTPIELLTFIWDCLGKFYEESLTIGIGIIIMIALYEISLKLINKQIKINL